MFSENLQRLRKAKGLSQEELGERLHVVRQTVSKWEKGLSVPDANLLIALGDIFEVPVSTLLGSAVEPPQSEELISQKLEQLNILLAERNRRSRLVWRVAAVVLLIGAVGMVLLLLFMFIFSFAAPSPDRAQAHSYESFAKGELADAAKELIGTSNLEQRLGEAIGRMEDVTAALVRIDEGQGTVTVSLVAEGVLREEQEDAITRLVTGALTDSYTVDIQQVEN